MSVSKSRSIATYVDAQRLSVKDASIFRTLLYFDIFKFPLTESELWRFGEFAYRKELKERLEWWVSEGYIIREGQYYLVDSSCDKVKNRELGASRVKKMWSKACRRSRLIQRFPFVKAVFISGSISKGVVAEDGDVDFFIITKPGRLWLSRTLLAIFKKIFLLGSHRYFCINYFIDEEYLEIEEKNRYTATEMVTLIPMTGHIDLINSFYEDNKWVREYYPNFSVPEVKFPGNRKFQVKKFTEVMLNFFGGGLMDDFSQWLTTTFWRMKFSEMESEDFKVALKSNKHVSKHHPLYFQKYVLREFEKGVSKFENAYGLKLKA